MNFYHAYYKRQRYDKDNEIWEDTYYDHQGIIVIANDCNEAKSQIKKCLTKVEHGNYRAVLIGDVVECIGLDRRHGFEDSFKVCPILSN